MAEYISREAAYNAIVNNYVTDEQLRALDCIPAADVRPVVRGKPVKNYETWLNSDMKPIKTVWMGWKCPFCGDTGIKNYCPNCGARMEG